MRSLIASQSIAFPIDGGQLFETNDPDEAEREMTRFVAPHRLEPLHAGPLALRQITLRRGAINLFQIGYGADVRIEADGCPPFYLVKMPLSGSGRIRSLGKEVEAGRPTAAFLNPDRPLAFDYGADCSFLVMAIEASALEGRCAELLEKPALGRSLDFDLGLDLESASGQQWLRLAAYLRDETLLGAPSAAASPLFLAPLQHMVTTTLLTVQRHAFSEHLLRPVSPAAPRSVLRAEGFMEANAHSPITPAEIAAAAGVSERALFRSFQQFRGHTPMAHLRSVRLDHVHHVLLSGEPGLISVTATAMEWGFTHLGHFGQAYRQRFGETPAATLRRLR
jgi:AraC-like DNA-binding protein